MLVELNLAPSVVEGAARWHWRHILSRVVELLALGHGKGLPLLGALSACSRVGASVSVVRLHAGPGAVYTAQEFPEQWSQGGKAAGDNADVEFDNAPRREIHCIPEPVATNAVASQVCDSHNGARGGKAAQAEDEEQGHSRSCCNVDVP